MCCEKLKKDFDELYERVGKIERYIAMSAKCFLYEPTKEEIERWIKERIENIRNC